MTITPVLESLFIIIKTIISGDTSYQGTFLKDCNGDALGIIPRNAANNTTRQMHIKSPIDSTNKCLLMDPTTTSTTQKNLTFILLKKKKPLANDSHELALLAQDSKLIRPCAPPSRGHR